MGENGFEVAGRDCTDALSGIGTVSASGAVWGELLERDLGKTRVINAICSAAYIRISPGQFKLEKGVVPLRNGLDCEYHFAISIQFHLPV